MGKAKEKECLGCSVPSKLTRGLCGSCYAAARRLVQRGNTTWALLIKAKLAEDCKIGRPPGALLQRAMAANALKK